MIRFDDAEPKSRDPDEKPLKEWRSKFEVGSLSTNDLIKFFQNSSPNFFTLESVTEGVKCTYNELGARIAIIDVLEEFILGDNPQKLLEKFKTEGSASGICGRVFKIGEPTYSCRECGMDTTCVLCVSCFKQSAHRFHKYKMSTSSGGGCCDCGDEEAWKKDFYCEDHAKGKDPSSDSNLITNRMRERCEITFRAMLIYCVRYLEIESKESLECLDGEIDDNLFCTVLYNDESHTFEQVINTLVKIVKIPQKDAMETVTSIDREGRAVVKCDSFEACANLKEAIERQPAPLQTTFTKSPLKCTVLHKRAVSNQQFALQLLTWFQEFLTRHKAFREIFTAIASDKRACDYNIAHILEYDWKLWKTARSCWHRLLISGMLMDYENKKILAIEFSKHYSSIIQDFIRDDHEHSISIVSLSVQLFTVPTIAHYLIANEGIFYKLLHTFYCECIKKYVEEQTLKFAKNTANMNVFKRSSFILYDLRYILSFKPDVWTQEIREGFLDGVKVLLQLLNVMQGMDAMFRQTGQHMDYEPEWESAFNLHIKLASVITLVLEWCATDKESLMKVYQMVMRDLMENQFIISDTLIEEQTLAGHVAKCVMYDVSSKNVSIHLPLSRFFAGIYLLLGEYDLNFYNVTTMAKRTPEEIMEPILCAQTMIAQVHAGMWRRNGYSLLHQLFFYRNVRCRPEMLDRDIAGLQIGAALIESNQFLIHILNKFSLIEWAQPDYEPNQKHINDDDFIRQLNMIDEFLELLIVIIGERYVPGIANVTEEDRTKKEIIQQLCIRNFTHSELNKCLPDTNNETILEDVIDSIAIFKKPNNSDTRGVYELKEEFYDDYNMYFYHYTKEEKSKSEETQRLRRKEKSELVCCPPPKLPKLCNGFVTIANLLQCDVMLSLMEIILKRGLDLKAKSFNENHLQKILHLIGYGLLEEESQNYPFLTFYERATKCNLLQLLEKLSHSTRVEAHRDFIIWTVKKFKELQPKEKQENNEMESEDNANQPITAAQAEKQEKEQRARLAAERRAKIMAQMQNAQKNFMKSNAELFASTSSTTSVSESDQMECEDDGTTPKPVEMVAGQDIVGLETDVSSGGATCLQDAEMENTSVACLGPNRRHPNPEEQKYICILCFENCVVSRDGPCLVYSVFIQKSRILTSPEDESNLVLEDGEESMSPYTGTCGHVMHASCWNQYYDNEILKENRRPNRNRSPNNFTIDKKEFLCPYCRCLSNAVIPLTVPLYQYSAPVDVKSENDVLSFASWQHVMQTYLQELYIQEQKQYFNKRMTAKIFVNITNVLEKCEVNNDEYFKKICEPIKRAEVASQWNGFADIFMNSVKRVSPYPYSSEDCERFLVTWNSCAYTIRSLEMYFRAIDKPLNTKDMSIRHKSVLDGLVRVCGMLGAVLTTDIDDQLMIHLRGLLETIFQKERGPSILEWDVFNILCNAVFLTPAVMYSYNNSHVVPSGHFFEYYFLQMMFLANCAKALILYNDYSSDHQEMEIDLMEKDEIEADKNDILEMDTISRIYRKFNLQYRKQAATEEIEVSEKTLKKIIDYIKQENLQFLRCTSLLFHFMTDVEFPPEFSETNADQFEIMCKYLGLNPDITKYFTPNSDHLRVMEDFCLHPDIIFYDAATETKRDGKKFNIVPCDLPIRQLIALPDDYSDLINSISDYKCPNNPKEDIKNPTMCLVCGSVLCGQSYCCQPELHKSAVGACTYHAHYCGAGIGIFLRIRDCQILYLGQNKGCFMPAPYLDEYGEADQGLRRGNPLRLCRERFRKLHLSWLGHGLHEEIARLNESSNSVLATQWQHM